MAHRTVNTGKVKLITDKHYSNAQSVTELTPLQGNEIFLKLLPVGPFWNTNSRVFLITQRVKRQQNLYMVACYLPRSTSRCSLTSQIGLDNIAIIPPYSRNAFNIM